MNEPCFVKIGGPGGDFINLNQIVRTRYTAAREQKHAELIVFFAVPRVVAVQDGATGQLETELHTMRLGGFTAEDFQAYLDHLASDVIGFSKLSPPSNETLSPFALVAARAVGPWLAKQPGPAMSDPWRVPKPSEVARRIQDEWASEGGAS